MKNILIIGTGYGTTPAVDGGAIETLLDMYLQKNKSEYKNNITVYSILSKKIKGNMKQENIEYRYIDVSKISFKIERLIRNIVGKVLNKYIGNAYINKIIKDLKQKHELNKYDIVIVENIGKYCILLNKLFENKIVLYLHNDYLNIDTKWKEKILENSSEVWGVSKFICNRVKEIDKENKYKTKVELLYNGIDFEKFMCNYNKQQIDKCKKTYGIKENDFTFLYIGRVFDGKGVKELIEAYCKFLEIEEKKDSKLIIVGGIGYNQKQYYEEITKIASKHTENIKFIGNVKYEDIPMIYKIANVQFVPSLLNEAFGLIVIEGIASKIPVIISDSGGMPEIIGNNKDVIVKRENIVEELYAKMKELYKNEKLLQEISNEQSSYVSKFDKNNYCNNFETLIKNFKQKEK